MANRQRASLKEALEAATAGMVNPPPRPGQTPEPGPEPTSPPAPTPDSTETSTPKKSRGEAGAPTDTPEVIPMGKPTRSSQETSAQHPPRAKPAPSQAREGHQKTSTGYVTASGEKIVRLTLHMTPAQKRALKMKMLEAGHDSPSAYLIDVLGLS